MNLIRNALAAAALTAACSPCLAAPAAPRAAAAASRTAQAAVVEFVAAFNALDMPRFQALFADDATLFFPGRPFEVRRVQGKAEVMKWFGRFFSAAKARSADAKLNIEARDLLVQDYGNVAVATFHLDGGERVGRRTLVLHRQGGRWKIVHLHASSEPVGAPLKPGSE